MKTQSNPFEEHLRCQHTPGVHGASQANQSSRSSTRLRSFCAAAMVSAALLISACGGGGSDSNSSPGPSTSGSSTSSAPGVQVLSDSAGISVAVSNGSTTSTASATATSTSTGTVTTPTTTTSTTATGTTTTGEIVQMIALKFEGEVKEGPSKDTKLKGRLSLTGTSKDGGKTTQLTGQYLPTMSMGTSSTPSTATSTTSTGTGTGTQSAAITALNQKFDADAKALAKTLQTDVLALADKVDVELKPLRDEFKAVNPLAADAEGKYKAIIVKAKAITEKFTAALKTSFDKFGSDLKALHAAYEKDLAALASPGNTGQTPTKAITVAGTLGADGKITLTFDLGNGSKIEGVGQRDAKGKFAGTFTGPAAGDKGVWTAEGSMNDDPTTPPTMPPGTTPTMPPGTGTTPTMPPATTTVPPGTGTASCSGKSFAVSSLIDSVSGPTSFVLFLPKGVSVGVYKDGFPIDASAAKFVNGTAADIAVGKRVAACADEPLNYPPLGNAPPTPIKVSLVVFAK